MIFGAAATRNVENLHPVPVLTHDGAIACVRELLPAIRQRSAKTDSDRRLPRETIDSLLQSGLFGITIPKTFGGSGLGFESLVTVATEIGAACGSSGWVFGVVGGHHSLVALFDEQAQREVYGDPTSLVSTVFRLSGKTVPEGDGFRLTGGEGRFCSGVDFANWVIVGNPVLRDGAAPEPSFLLIPISEVEIVDDWFTAGMRGTGSRSIRISSTFVPAHRVIRLADMLVGKTPGASYHALPAYKLPMGLQQPFTLIGAPLGMARGALSEFAASLGKKLGGQSGEEIAEQSATFARLGQAAVDIESSYGLVIDTCRRIDAAVDPTSFTPLDRALVKRNLAFAAQKSRAAVNSLFEASGGSGIYDGSALQRSWRDINAATGHVAFTWDAAASAYGRALAGLPPSRFAMP